MSDYEQMIINAVRYALGISTYIVTTIEYVIKDINENKLSKKCLENIRKDITEELSYDKLRIDYTLVKDVLMEWQRLLDRIEKELR